MTSHVEYDASICPVDVECEFWALDWRAASKGLFRMWKRILKTYI
jgi:hypothetical protein